MNLVTLPCHGKGKFVDFGFTFINMIRSLYLVNVLNFVLGFLFLSVLNSIGGELISSFQFRIFSLTLSLLVIFTLLRKSEFLLLLLKNKKMKYYYFFITLYLIHIFFDTFFTNAYTTVFKGDPAIFFFMTLSYLIITPLSLISIIKLDLRVFLKYLYILYACIFILNLIVSRSIIDTNNIDTSDLRESSFSHVGVINSSVFAAILFLWSLTNLLNKKASVTARVIYGVMATISIIDIALASTKSSFIAIIAILILYLIQNYQQIGNRKFIAAIISVVLFINFTYSFWSERLSVLFSRFHTLSTQGDEARQYIWSTAIKQFTKSPYIGSSFVIPGKAFFHNFFLDAFVTTGIIGGILFVFLNIKVWRIAIKWLKTESDKKFFAIAFMILFITGLSSSNLFMDYSYWGYLLIVLSLDYNINKPKFFNYVWNKRNN
jgi:O-antigen ligase